MAFLLLSLATASPFATGWSWTADAPSDRLGHALATGDLNGDGFDDLAASAPNTRQVYVFFGGGSGLGVTPDLVVEAEASALLIADLDGDGFGDLVVGGSGKQSGFPPFVQLHRGGVAGPARDADWIADGPLGSRLGAALTVADFDQDGLPDLVAGAPTRGSPLPTGAVYAWFGAAEGLGDAPTWSWVGEEAGRGVGQSVSAGGDVDGDGHPDLAVAAPAAAHDKGGGAVILFRGGPEATLTPAWTVEQPNPTLENRFGLRVLLSTELTGDGHADLLVQERTVAPYPDRTQKGHTSLFVGGPDGPDPAPVHRMYGKGTSEALLPWPDTDGDGRDEILVGHTARGHQHTAGVWRFRSRTEDRDATLAPELVIHVAGSAAHYAPELGFALASGDFDGDGTPELAVGDPASVKRPRNNDQPGYVHVFTWDRSQDEADSVATYVDADGDGHRGAYDCDPANPDVNWRAPEICDGLDNDCNGRVDDRPTDGVPWYADADGDGWGSGGLVYACDEPRGRSTVDGDCDDTDPTRSPSTDETCDGVDNDCDGRVDEDLPDRWFADADGDGRGDPAQVTDGCAPPEGWVADGTDCDDTDPALPRADGSCEEVAKTGCGCGTTTPGSAGPGLAALAVLGLAFRRRAGG